jgi:hypothetical protein
MLPGAMPDGFQYGSEFGSAYGERNRREIVPIEHSRDQALIAQTERCIFTFVVTALCLYYSGIIHTCSQQLLG